MIRGERKDWNKKEKIDTKKIIVKNENTKWSLLKRIIFNEF